MKYNEDLFNLLDKYVEWAKFNRCSLIYNPITNKMFAYDFEDKKVRSISYVIQCMLDNEMLDECFSQHEIKELIKVVPKRFKPYVRDYLVNTELDLIKVPFTHFNGYFWVENFMTKHENEDRCNIYDENLMYLDYIAVYDADLDWDNDIEENYQRYQNIVKAISRSKTPLDAFDQFCQSFDYGDTLEDVILNYKDSLLGSEEDFMQRIDDDLHEMSELEFCVEYDINKLGNMYFKGEW